MSVPKGKSYKDMMKNEPRNTFSSSKKWLKLDIGTHHLRLAPPWSDEGIPYRSIEQHHGFTYDDKKVAPICLDFIFIDKDRAKRVITSRALNKEDFEKVKQHGCPMCNIATALVKMKKKTDKDDKDYQKFARKKAYMFNVVVRDPKNKDRDNQPFIWSKSQTFFDQVMTALEPYPDLFDVKKGNDFSINATGEGLNRKYSPPYFYNEKTPLNLAKGAKLHDLDEALEIGVKTFDEIVEMCRHNHTTAVKRSGIDLNDYMN